MKTILLAGLLVLSTLTLSACSTTTDAADSVINESIGSGEANELVLPERKSEVSGVVKSIIGNEVTISLLLKSGAADTEDGAEPTPLTDEEKAAKQAANQANKDAGETGTGMTDVELSGETLDLVIPVGTNVVTKSSTGELISVNIGDLNRGNTVKIWLLEGGEGDLGLAEFVQILTQ